jgi:uncharacterized protein
MTMRILLFFIISSYLIGSVHGQNLPKAAKEKEILLPVAGGNLSGTLSLPKRAKDVPVVLLIAGSGPTDRNGNNAMAGKNNGLQYLAWHLAEAGIASLRYDKRGIAASKFPGMKEDKTRFDDLVGDAVAWVAWLRQDKRFNKVVIAGHSEGSLIGMIAAQGRADAFVSIAGAGRPATTILKDQLAAQKVPGLDVLSAKIDSVKAGQTVHAVTPMDAMLFRPSVQPYLQSWFRFDPAEEIAKLQVPVLIIQGTRDIQIGTLDAEMLHAAQPAAQLSVVEDMNHVFRIVESNDPAVQMATYGNIQLPLAVELHTSIVRFVLAR